MVTSQTDSVREIESALLCGYSSVDIEGVRIPLAKWELNPRKTRKQQEEQAREHALDIYSILIS